MNNMKIDNLSNRNREAIKWGETPEIQKKADKTAKNAMSDGFVEQIKEYAKKDAQKGVYMSDDFIQFRLAHMDKSVSPNRSGPVAQVTTLLQDAAKEYDPRLELLDMMLGKYSVKGRITPTSQTAEIYSPDGEMIAGYNSLGGGWHMVQTEAESKFLGEAASVYAQAFKEARTDMNTTAQKQVPQINSSSIDVRV